MKDQTALAPGKTAHLAASLTDSTGKTWSTDAPRATSIAPYLKLFKVTNSSSRRPVFLMQPVAPLW